MVWLKALPGYVYQSDIPGTPTITSWGAEFDQATSDAILAEAAGWNRRNRQGQVLVVVGDPPIYTPGGSTGGGGGSSGGGVSQEAFDAAIATLQGKATAATDAELAAAVATINIALGTKQDAASAVTSSEFAAAIATLQDKATAATDSELASAVATLNSALAGKQDAASAATDSEVAAAVASLNSAIAGKQDAATAATDAELAAAVATINAAIAANSSAILLKQDASTAATDAELLAHASDALLHSSGQELAYAENISGVVQSYSTNGSNDVIGVSIVVPPSTRPVWVEAEIRVGITVAPAAGASSSLAVNILDDLGATIAAGNLAIEGGAGITGVLTLRARGRVGPLAAQRTYRAQVNRSGGAVTYFVFNGALTSAGGNVTPAFRSWIGAFAK